MAAVNRGGVTGRPHTRSVCYSEATKRAWEAAAKRQRPRTRNDLFEDVVRLFDVTYVRRVLAAHEALVSAGRMLEAEGLEEVLARIDPGEAEAAKGARQDAARQAAEARAAGGGV